MPDPVIPPSDQSGSNPADKFIGLTGRWKALANFGIVGVVAALMTYLVTVELPSVQERFHSTLRQEREAARQELGEERRASREEAEKSRQHGNQATKELGSSIQQQTFILSQHQLQVQENQRELIAIQKKISEAMTKNH